MTERDPSTLSPRKQQAVAAALGAGRALGLEVGTPAILHDGFSVVVHLAPAPVVARVPTVLPPGLTLDDHAARQAREVAVVHWLDTRGVPVVRPSPLAPRAPVQRDGFSMTFWEKVEVDAAASPDFCVNAARIPALHAALADCPVDLPFLSPVAMSVPSALAHLGAHPGLADAEVLDKAQRSWDALAPMLASAATFRARFPRARVQPIHGDAPAYNLVQTTTGSLHADFEDATLGLPEWDLAGFGPECHAAYDEAAARGGLPALDPVVMAVMEEARSLQMVAALAMAPDFPGLAEGIEPMIAAWRAKPFVLEG